MPPSEEEGAKELKVGQMVGEYKLVSFLGAGGMSATYLAKHPQLDKKVVIKVLLPEMAGHPEARGYFSAEGKLGAKMHNANIVNLIVRGDLPSHNTGYIVLEYVEGVNLERVIDVHHALPVDMAIYFLKKILEGLDYIHNVVIDGQPGDVVHRDLTPDNVFLSCAAEVKIGDFGIAQVAAALRLRTRVKGQIKGKWKYLPPEMLRYQPVDRRADLFQAGLILYEMLTGVAAFSANAGTQAGIDNILAGKYQPIASLRSDVPEALIRFTETLMATEPRDRPSTAAIALDLLEEATHSFYRESRAKRDIIEMVTRLSNLSASTSVPVPEQLRQLLAASLAKAPPAPSVVPVTAAPHERTLIPAAPTPGPNGTKNLDAEQMAAFAGQSSSGGGVPSYVEREGTRAGKKRKGGGAVAVAIRAEASPNTPLDMAPTQPLRSSPSSRSRRRRVLLLIAGVGVVCAAVVAGAVLLGRRETQKPPTTIAEAEPATPPPAPAAPAAPAIAATAPPATAHPAVATPEPPAPAAPLTTPRAAAPSAEHQRKRERGDEAEKGLGIIVVRKDPRVVRVLIDGMAVPAPVRFPVEPGAHTVELVGPDSTTHKTVNVSAGHHFYVKPEAEAAAATTPIAAAPARTYESAMTDAQESYVRRQCASAQKSAHEAVTLASNGQGRDKALRIEAGALCCLHDAQGIAHLWSALDDDGKSWARYVCSRYGVELPK